MFEHENYGRVELDGLKAIELSFVHGVAVHEISIDLYIRLLKALLNDLVDQLIWNESARDHTSLNNRSQLWIFFHFLFQKGIY